ncbi:hypothetical protein DFS34DRAFT_601937 [Phlyctochytrium arcticum]|nr:hypothetical protein DFS34DRAFT_601937 [Phlyctochytrium arcticum]
MEVGRLVGLVLKRPEKMDMLSAEGLHWFHDGAKLSMSLSLSLPSSSCSSKSFPCLFFRVLRVQVFRSWFNLKSLPHPLTTIHSMRLKFLSNAVFWLPPVRGLKRGALDLCHLAAQLKDRIQKDHNDSTLRLEQRREIASSQRLRRPYNRAVMVVHQQAVSATDSNNNRTKKQLFGR